MIAELGKLTYYESQWDEHYLQKPTSYQDKITTIIKYLKFQNLFPNSGL